MEEVTRPTPIETPETSAPSEVTPVDPTIEPTTETVESAADRPASASRLPPVTGVTAGICAAFALPVDVTDPTRGEIACVPCPEMPVEHGYIVCRVLPDETAQVCIIPPACAQAHPITEERLNWIGDAARSIAHLALATRRSSTPLLPPAPQGATGAEEDGYVDA